MIVELNETKDTFFTHYGKYVSPPSKKMTSIPFKNHPQFQILADILSRQNHHHAIICADFSANVYISFLQALLEHLNQDSIPHPLRKTKLMCLNLENALFTEIKQLSIEKDFEALRNLLTHSDKYLLVTLPCQDLFSKESKKADERFLRRQIETLIAHPRCRFLLTTDSTNAAQYRYLADQFSFLHITELTDTDVIAILKQQRIEFEFFHKVEIPEELLSQTYLLAERFLSTTHTLEKTLLLLDSSAARISAGKLMGATSQTNPVLPLSTVLDVLSDWTNIPSSHLLINQFKYNVFVQDIQQYIFGQDMAITIIGHELLQAQTHLQQKQGPFSSFLFAGPTHAGKKTTAFALTEQLFKQSDALYFAHPTLTNPTLADTKLQRGLDKQFFSITDVVRQTPYAIIMFENVEKYSLTMLNGIQEILSTGYLHDIDGNQHNFRQTIIILSTTIGAQSLTELAETLTPNEDNYTMDLMQLVINEQKQETRHLSQYSAQEIIEKIMPDIIDTFSLSLCQHLHLVPFVPLNKMAIEKIIRLKLKILGKQLNARYGIELGYAPEVIRYLTNEVLIKWDSSHQSINPSKALKQLYFCVEQAILNQADDTKYSNQLFLQLNDMGHLLRCDWLPLTATQEYP
jgi:DNA polymerase III delta prime subunit